MRITLIVLIFILALQASAQNTPASTVFHSNTIVPEHSQHIFLFASSKQAKPKILDRKFLVLAGMATAATVLDLATTSHCISSYANCQEANPLIGANPSQAKLYGVSFSMLAGQLLASAWMRHSMPNRKLWMVPSIAATAGHGLAAALNIRTMHQLAQ
jgi:hypothetical protein